MQALIILVKNPIAGKTKTRLAASVGHPTALKMYHQMMAHTREQASALADTRLLLRYSERVITDDDWSPNVFEKGVQRGEDLGVRMANAFQEAFESGAQRAVIIGSDCLGITTELLTDALKALTDRDVVIGPALDGGYYLLGMSAYYPDLFRDIAWSTEDVARQTRDKAAAAGLSVEELVPLSDVDYLEDWQHYGWPIPD